MDTIEESLLCLDDLDPLELVLSSPPKYLPSSLTFLLSFLPLLEKNDLPPEDCLDLLSAVDMMLQFRRFNPPSATCGYSPMRLTLNRLFLLCSSMSQN